jgi:hypothetical protein
MSEIKKVPLRSVVGGYREAEIDTLRAQSAEMLAALREVFAFRYSNDERTIDAWVRVRAILDREEGR